MERWTRRIQHERHDDEKDEDEDKQKKNEIEEQAPASRPPKRVTTAILA